MGIPHETYHVASWGKAPGEGESTKRNIELSIEGQSQCKVFHTQEKTSCKELGSTKDHNPLSVMVATGEGCI